MNIFISGFVDYVKLNKSEIYIARLHVQTHVNGEHTSKIFLFESSNPELLKSDILTTFDNVKSQIGLMYPSEILSNIKAETVKYRRFNVIQILNCNNLIKSKKA